VVDFADRRLDASAGEEALDEVLRELYRVISFPEGGNPDWEGMAGLFLKCARITRITPEARDEFDVDTFMAMLSELLESGVYTSFFEREVGRRTELFGSMAHVLSAYETKRTAEATARLGVGVNSIQLVREQGTWRILSLLWDEGHSHLVFSLEQFENLEMSHSRLPHFLRDLNLPKRRSPRDLIPCIPSGPSRRPSDKTDRCWARCRYRPWLRCNSRERDPWFSIR
jgi:hypothetical protein